MNDFSAIEIVKRGLTLPVVLVGMPAAGKTSLGIELARTLGLPFIDTDHRIEAETGETIAALFEKNGEAGFRDLESQTIASVFASTPGAAVIATGGGAVLRPDNRALLFGDSFSVWVRAPVDILLARSAAGRARPLLNVADPAQRLRDLEAARCTYYKSADISVETGQSLPEDIVPEIIAAIAERITSDA